MEIVVDASIVIRWIIAQQGSARAQEFLSNALEDGVRLTAPDILRDEVLGTLSRLYRRGHITAAEAHDAYWLFRHFRPQLQETAGIADAALALSLQHQLSYWDALYVALASMRGSELVTADARLYRSIARSFPGVRLL